MRPSLRSACPLNCSRFRCSSRSRVQIHRDGIEDGGPGQWIKADRRGQHIDIAPAGLSRGVGLRGHGAIDVAVNRTQDVVQRLALDPSLSPMRMKYWQESTWSKAARPCTPRSSSGVPAKQNSA